MSMHKSPLLSKQSDHLLQQLCWCRSL